MKLTQPLGQLAQSAKDSGPANPDGSGIRLAGISSDVPAWLSNKSSACEHLGNLALRELEPEDHNYLNCWSFARNELAKFPRSFDEIQLGEKFSAWWSKNGVPENEDTDDNAPDAEGSVNTSLVVPFLHAPDMAGLPHRMCSGGWFHGESTWVKQVKGGGLHKYTQITGDPLSAAEALDLMSILRTHQAGGAWAEVDGAKISGALYTYLSTIVKDERGRRKLRGEKVSGASGEECDRLRERFKNLIECTWKYELIQGGKIEKVEEIGLFTNIEYSRVNKGGKGTGKFKLTFHPWLLKQLRYHKSGMKPVRWGDAKGKKRSAALGVMLHVDKILSRKPWIHSNSATQANRYGLDVPVQENGVTDLLTYAKQRREFRGIVSELQGTRLSNNYKAPGDMMNGARCFVYLVPSHRNQSQTAVFTRVTEDQWDLLSYMGLTSELQSMNNVLQQLQNLPAIVRHGKAGENNPKWLISDTLNSVMPAAMPSGWKHPMGTSWVGALESHVSSVFDKAHHLKQKQAA